MHAVGHAITAATRPVVGPARAPGFTPLITTVMAEEHRAAIAGERAATRCVAVGHSGRAVIGHSVRPALEPACAEVVRPTHAVLVTNAVVNVVAVVIGHARGRVLGGAINGAIGEVIDRAIGPSDLGRCSSPRVVREP